MKKGAETAPFDSASSLGSSGCLHGVRVAQADVQLAQRLGIHHARRLGHDTGRALGFREGNHFAEIGCVGECGFVRAMEGADG